jgi:hypothetical protein
VGVVVLGRIQIYPFQGKLYNQTRKTRFLSSLKGCETVVSEKSHVNPILGDLCNHTREVSDPSLSK